jgi:hypothetical protein
MSTEYEYFAAQSGLQAGTLSDHQYAYYAARSGLVAAATRTNLFTNPGVDVDVSEWYGFFSPGRDRVTDEKNLGIASVKVTTTVDTTRQGVVLFSSNGLDDTAYTSSVWAKGPAGLVLSIGSRTENPQQKGGDERFFTMTGGWVRMHTTYKLTGGPFGLLGLQLSTIEPLPPIGTVFFVGDALIEKTDQLRSNFSGAERFPSNIAYAWTGAQFLSTSTATPATVAIGSLADHQLAFFKLQNGNTMHDLGWQRLTYYRNLAGNQTLGLGDARAAVFAAYNIAQTTKTYNVMATVL